MNTEARVRAKPTTSPPPSVTPVPSGLLQRKCACGGTPGADGECAECRKKRLSAQRKASGPGDRSIAPPIVHDVLRSPGRPLDPEYRSLLESRLGHDFSQVRIHTDTRAAESAREINALAYAVGRNVVFGAGRYAPESSEGRRLLAHELTHVVQQRGAPQEGPRDLIEISPCGGLLESEADRTAERVALGGVAQEGLTSAPVKLQRACGRIEIGRVDGCVGQSGDILGDSFLFNIGCDTLRADTSPTEEERLRLYVGRVSQGEALEIHGFASEEGDESFNENLSCARAVEARTILRAELARAGISATIALFKHGATAGDRPNRRSVVIRGIAPDLPSPAARTISCSCGNSTRRPYLQTTLDFIRSIRSTIRTSSGGTDILAVAGAIADEYDTRQGIRVAVDGLQDTLLDILPESFIDVDRFFDFNARLLNTMRNDVGPANINVQTALDLVQREELSVPGSPVSDVQVNRIIDFLLTEDGTVEASVAVIRRSRRLFGPYLGEHGHDLAESILVEYFKQGDRYYARFLQSALANPDHRVCPGEGGCRFLFNADSLREALR